MKKNIYVALSILFFIFLKMNSYKKFACCTNGLVSYIESNCNTYKIEYSNMDQNILETNNQDGSTDSVEIDSVKIDYEKYTAPEIETEDTTSWDDWQKSQINTKIPTNTVHKKSRIKKIFKDSNFAMIDLTCGIFNNDDCTNFAKRKKEVEESVKYIENRIKRDKSDIFISLKKLKKDKSFYHSYFIIKDKYCIFDSENNDTNYTEIDSSLIESFNTTKAEGDWFFYPYFDQSSDIKYSFIKKIMIEQNTYFIGASIYPDQINLKVEQVISHIKKIVENNPLEESISIIKNRESEFLLQLGDVNITILDSTDSVLFSYNKSFENINIKELKDQDGKYFFQEIMQKTKELKNYTLTANINGNKIIFNSIFVEKSSGESYIVIADYIEKITGEDVVLLVSKIIQEINVNGLEQTIQKNTDLNNLSSSYPFKPIFIRLMSNEIKGDLSGFFNNNNISLVTDKYGNMVFSKMLMNIEKLDKGWISFASSEGYAEFYYQIINTADGKYIIGCICHPYSRLYHAKINADNIIHRMANLSLEQIGNLILHSPANIFSNFLHLDIYNNKGMCLLTSDPKLELFSNPFNNKQWATFVEICQGGGGIYALKEKNYKIINIVRLLKIENKDYFLRIYYKE